MHIVIIACMNILLKLKMALGRVINVEGKVEKQVKSKCYYFGVIYFLTSCDMVVPRVSRAWEKTSKTGKVRPVDG